MFIEQNLYLKFCGKLKPERLWLPFEPRLFQKDHPQRLSRDVQRVGNPESIHLCGSLSTWGLYI